MMELTLEVLPNGPVKRVAVLDAAGTVMNVILAADDFVAHLRLQGTDSAEITPDQTVSPGDRYDVATGRFVPAPTQGN
jgi:hypothetical protein